MASRALGRIPGLSEFPWMVNVLPDDVAPYVKISWFRPSKNSFSFGSTISLKMDSCSHVGGKILLNVNLWKRLPPLFTEFLYVTLSLGALRAIWKRWYKWYGLSCPKSKCVTFLEAH